MSLLYSYQHHESKNSIRSRQLMSFGNNFFIKFYSSSTTQKKIFINNGKKLPKKYINIKLIIPDIIRTLYHIPYFLLLLSVMCVCIQLYLLSVSVGLCEQVFVEINIVY